jgi:DNA-binding transcriptional ArsR family regulator
MAWNPEADVLKTFEQKRGEAFFRSLADDNLLRLVGALVNRERTPAELAELLELKPPILARLLDHLTRLNLVTMRNVGDSMVYRLDVTALRQLIRETFPGEPTPTFDADVVAGDWEQDVLRNFFVGERLKEIPVVPRKRDVVLRWLAGRFESSRRYPESEVNGILHRHHPDCAALRRYLVDEGFLQRDHGVYWRNLPSDIVKEAERS